MKVETSCDLSGRASLSSLGRGGKLRNEISTSPELLEVPELHLQGVYKEQCSTAAQISYQEITSAISIRCTYQSESLGPQDDFIC